MPTKKILFGRKHFSFAEGTTTLDRMSVTERPKKGEDETCFTNRLVKQYGNQQGAIEIVIKNGLPDYAIITFDLDEPIA